MRLEAVQITKIPIAPPGRSVLWGGVVCLESFENYTNPFGEDLRALEPELGTPLPGTCKVSVCSGFLGPLDWFPQPDGGVFCEDLQRLLEIVCQLEPLRALLGGFGFVSIRLT